MSYFLINGVDYSNYVSELKVNTEANYISQTNAAGNTVVDFINHKRTIEVGIIPVDSAVMKDLMSKLNNFSVSISFRNPSTGEIEYDVLCIIPDSNIEYYTIQADKVLYKAFNLEFIEL